MQKTELKIKTTKCIQTIYHTHTHTQFHHKLASHSVSGWTNLTKHHLQYEELRTESVL